MDWIKKHYDQFLLALAAVLLLAVTFLLIQRVKGFNERFAAAQVPASPKKDVPALALEPVDEAKARLEAPAQWKPSPDLAFLLVPQRYIIDPGTKKPVKLDQGVAVDSVTGQPIPFQWFLDHNLDPLAAGVTLEDADKDGFSNEDEWRYKTDPTKQDSHPPQLAKLFFKQWVKQTFRLQFMAVSAGDKRKDKKEDLDLQINPLSTLGASQLVKLGQVVPGSEYKVIDYVFKEGAMTGTGEREEAPEVTVENVISGDKVILPIGKVVESPESVGIFDYVWPTPPATLKFMRGQVFTLEPDKTTKYKLVDITQNEAVIALPSGEKMTIKPDARGKR